MKSYQINSLTSFFRKAKLIHILILVGLTGLTSIAIIAALPVFPNKVLYLRRFENKFRILTQELDFVYQLTDFTMTDTLPSYTLMIDPNDIEKIVTALPSDKEQKLATENKIKVPATVLYNQQQLPAKVWVRGELWPHWFNQKKSLKVDLDNESINGNSTLNFIIPEERGYIDQAAALILGKKMGLYSPRFHYGWLNIDNQNQGVYFITEDLNEDFLKSLNIGPELSIFAEEEFSLENNLYSSEGEWKVIASTTKKNLNPINQLQHAFALEDDQEFYREAERLFDMDYFLSWQALSIILGDTHQGNFHNNRILYDHQKQKLYFIPDDVKIRVPDEINFGKQYSNENVLIARVLKNPEWLKQRNQIVLDTISSGKVNELITDLQDLVKKISPAIYKDHNKFPSTYTYIWDIRYKFDFLQRNLENLKNDLTHNLDSFYSN